MGRIRRVLLAYEKTSDGYNYEHFYALLITYTNKNSSLILKYLLEMPFDSYQGRIA